MKTPLTRAITISICIIAGSASFLSAQTTVNSGLTGWISDPVGAAVPDALIELKNLETGSTYSTMTDGVGRYILPRIAPGAYEFSAAREGFRRAVQKRVVIVINEMAVNDVQLQLGQVTDAVTVSEDANIVQLQSAQIGGIVNSRRVQDLPLNGQNFAKLVLLAPGVASGSPNNPSISGARPVANTFTIDGVSANDERGSSGLALGGGGAAEFSSASPNLVPTEAVQEFSIVTSNADATFGRGSGGQINIITRSGSNAFHGSVYEYLRNNKLDARDFFNTGPFFAKDGSGRSVVPPFRQNLFGGSIGGPLVQNKHFFFANYEGFIQKLEQTASATVPNAALIGLIPGELGKLYRIFYIDGGIVPATGNPAGSFSALPAADRNAAVAGGFPTTLFDGDVTNGETGSVLLSTANTRNVKQNSILLRTDHQFGSKWTTSVRYSFAQPFAQTNTRAVTGVVNDSYRRWQSGMVQAVYTASPAQVFEWRGGLLRSRIKEGPHDPMNQALVDFGVDRQLGLTSRANGTSLSTLTISGETGFLDNETVPQGSFLHTWTHGNLTLRSGADIRRLDINVLLLSNTTAFQFTGIVGSLGIIGQRYGQPEAIVQETNTTLYGVNGGPTTALRGWRSTEQEYFTQADYRWRRNLTLNLGLRYSLFGTYSEVGNFMGNLYAVNPANGQIVPGVDAFHYGRFANIVAPVRKDRPFHQPDRNNFQPRLGVAWSLGRTAGTVIRASAGMYTDRFFQRLFDFGVLNQPYAFSNVFTSAPFPKGSRIILDPAIPAQGRFISPALRNPNTYRFNVAVEQKLSANTSVTAAYVGSRSSGLYRWEEPNGLGSWPQNVRPDPRYARYRYVTNKAASQYDSLQLYARHRYSKGIDFTVSYTYGSSMDDYSQDVGDNSQRNPAPGLAQFPSIINLDGSPASGFQGGTRIADRPARAEWGHSDFDVRHSLTISHVIELPVGHGRRFGFNWNRVLNAIFGGFSLSGIATIRSAVPVYLSSGIDYADVGITTSPRPALLKGSIDDLYTHGGLGKTQFLRPKPEIDQYLGTPANATDPYAATQRNILQGPPIQNYDVSLIKRITMQEQRTLTFEANFFNVMNHAIMGPPIAVLSDSRFGRITNTLPGYNPRQIQLAVKFVY
jgi:Carboxypeptidase regulatory-like domain